MSDDSGVMGNLPRSRPGHRSAKRDSAAAPKRGKTTAKATATKATAAKPASRAKPRTTTPRKAKPATTERRRAEPAAAKQRERSRDPITEALHLAGTVAETGFKIAGGILRRLPRP